MARKSVYQIAQTFIEKASGKNEAVSEALGIGPRLVELFLVALHGIPEEAGRNITDLNKSAVKLEYASSYITQLSRNSLIERGDNRGEWRLTKKAVKIMSAFNNGNLVPRSEKSAKETSAQKAKKSRRRTKRLKKTKKRLLPAKRPNVDVDRMTIGEVVQTLRAIDREIAAASGKRKAIQQAFRARIKQIR